MFCNVIKLFQPKNSLFRDRFAWFLLKKTLSIPHLTEADKQGICLKMQEMAILETLIFTFIETHTQPAFGVFKLGVYASYCSVTKI